MEMQERILGAATKLFMRLGVRSVAMDDVAKEIGISKKTIYKHFKDKDELVYHSITLHISAMENSVLQILEAESNPVFQIANIADFVVSMNKGMHPAILFDLQKYHPRSYENLVLHRNKFAYQSVLQNIQNGAAMGYYREDMKPELVSRIYCFLIFSLYENTLFEQGNNAQFENNYRETIKYHLYAVTTTKGKLLMEEIAWLHTENETT